jgi:hypothetical protein
MGANNTVENLVKRWSLLKTQVLKEVMKSCTNKLLIKLL